MTRSEPIVARHGFTLVEVLVALAIFAALGAVLSALQVGTLRASRHAQVRLQAAALLGDELVLQRVLVTAPGVVPAGGGGHTTAACALGHLPDEWTCSASGRCLALPGLAPCDARVFTVELRPPAGEPLEAHGAIFRPVAARP